MPSFRVVLSASFLPQCTVSVSLSWVGMAVVHQMDPSKMAFSVFSYLSPPSFSFRRASQCRALCLYPGSVSQLTFPRLCSLVVNVCSVSGLCSSVSSPVRVTTVSRHPSCASLSGVRAYLK
ncbi:hypothetical protein FA15DRAFT_42883 [Coprinopsis marcescibilis]|uniref:Secreted protein n=1 Tax=Coprinopsis marcescibilis TaxID=230819 RepID=A0A5C3L726_COPMA|nr:hypothetical protein FA15DRAFT_42883 [Coprinopsis marcescibilis]